VNERGLTGRPFSLILNHMVNSSEAAVTATFAALVDPTRRAILRRLAAGETTVGALARPFDMSLPAVSKHLKVLEGAGLIDRRKVGRERLCRLRPAALRGAADWLDFYRRFWDERLDRLARLVETPPADDRAPKRRKRR
jgi:DNA-binding transcriptional ArsR family regulator